MSRFRITAVLIAIAIFPTICSPVMADPLTGEILKFQQLPLTGGVPIINPYTGPYLNTNGLPIPTAATIGAPFPGHDELSTAYSTSAAPGWTGTAMADDFADTYTTPVVHVRWWGSYLNGSVPPTGDGVQSFLISFESDVPVAPTGEFSHPGTPLLTQIVTPGTLAPGSGTFTVTPVSGPAGPDGPLFQYNAELSLPFAENLPPNVPAGQSASPNTIYWLKIVALANPNQPSLNWGWHDRDWSIPDPLASVPPAVNPGEHIQGVLAGTPVWGFQDDAVSSSVTITPNTTDPLSPVVIENGFMPQKYIDGVDGPTGISSFSKDLAFELYTVPEPASVLLLSLGALALAAKHWRRRRLE